MVFVDEVAGNLLALIVVVKDTDHAVGKKADLLHRFPGLPVIVVFVQGGCCCLAFDKVCLLFVQLTELQQVVYELLHGTKLEIVGCTLATQASDLASACPQQARRSLQQLEPVQHFAYLIDVGVADGDGVVLYPDDITFYLPDVAHIDDIRFTDPHEVGPFL